MRGSLSGFGDIMDHPSAIHMNAIFIYCAAIFIYRVAWPRRFFLLTVFPFIAITYLAAQRRSAFISLGIALSILLLMIYRLYRKLFFVLAPIALVAGTIYLLAFWNSGSPLALPAQAVKSVISADSSSESDRLSNIYRDVENININWTIRNNPLMGIGFGQKFLILIPMADISFFEWYEYITHNSVVWIWMKAGIGGFVAMVLMIGAALQLGARAMWRMPNNDMGAATTFFTLYILMHMIFAYVDMSWSAQNLLFLGTSIGIINVIEQIVAKPVDLPQTRWPWVPKPQPELGLRED
jgi:O-antigen ligase